MKKMLFGVGILGMFDFFAYYINSMTAQNIKIENLTVLIALAAGLLAIFALLYIVDHEQKEQEKAYRAKMLDEEIRNVTLKLLYGEDATRGQNLPAKEEQLMTKGA